MAKPSELKKLEKEYENVNNAQHRVYSTERASTREIGAPEENLFLIRNVTIVHQLKGSELACRTTQLAKARRGRWCGNSVFVEELEKRHFHEKILVHPFSCFPLVMPIRIARSMKRLCTILVFQSFDAFRASMLFQSRPVARE